MIEIPKNALTAAAERLHVVFGYGAEHCEALAEEAILAAEEQWPHTTEQRDLRSSTGGQFERTWQATHRGPRQGKAERPFGFST